MEAGADLVVCAPVLAAAPFQEYVAQLRGAGVACPIWPSVLPLHAFESRAEFYRVARSLHLAPCTS